MNSNERSSHPSMAQIDYLLEFLERNPNLAKGFSKTQHARERVRRQWQELAVSLNSMGGASKTHKQWSKYWCDKKSAVKKKVAARAADRRRTGGGLNENLEELSVVEERIVALCGGEGFGTGDAHLAIQIFSENTEPLPCATEAVNIGDVAETEAADNTDLVPERVVERRPIARRLFMSPQNNFDPVQSQSTLHNFHGAPCPSPPPPTLSHTPTPQSMPAVSPSRRGATATNTSNNRAAISSRGVDSSSSRAAQPPSTPATAPSEVSPSRRGATLANTRRRVSTRRNYTSSSRSALPVASAPSQRRTEYARITERFLSVEEQLVEVQRSNGRVLQALVEQSLQCSRATAEAVAAVGDGLKALAEAVRNQ